MADSDPAIPPNEAVAPAIVDARATGANGGRDWRVCILVALALAGGTVVRTLLLARSSLGTDEGLTAYFVRGSWSDTFRYVRADWHPPLYFALLHGWTDLFGDKEVALRSFSVVAGSLMLGVLYLLGRRLFTTGCSAWAVLLAAASTYQIYFAQEARQYALLGLLATVAMFAYVRLLERGGGWRVVLLGIADAALIYTHYYGFFLTAAQGVHALVHAWRWRDRAATRGFWRIVTEVTTAGAITAALYAPWFGFFFFQFGRARKRFWTEEADSTQLGEAFLKLVDYRWQWHDWTWFAAGAAGVAVLLAATCWRTPMGAPVRTEERPGFRLPFASSVALLVAWILGGLIVPFLLTLGALHIFHERSILCAGPPLYLLLAFLASRIRPRLLACGVFALIVALPCATVGAYFARVVKPNVRAAVRWMEKNGLEAGAVVAVDPPEGSGVFEYYHGFGVPWKKWEDFTPAQMASAPPPTVFFLLSTVGAPKRPWIDAAKRRFGYVVTAEENFHLVRAMRLDRKGSR